MATLILLPKDSSFMYLNLCESQGKGPIIIISHGYPHIIIQRSICVLTSLSEPKQRTQDHHQPWLSSHYYPKTHHLCIYISVRAKGKDSSSSSSSSAMATLILFAKDPSSMYLHPCQSQGKGLIIIIIIIIIISHGYQQCWQDLHFLGS